MCECRTEQRTLRIPPAVLALAGFERDVLPEIGGELALAVRVAPRGRAVCLHPARVLAVPDVRVGVAGRCVNKMMI
jgi:hypothetical protein